jgi:hypothetical protein
MHSEAFLKIYFLEKLSNLRLTKQAKCLKWLRLKNCYSCIILYAVDINFARLLFHLQSVFSDLFSLVKLNLSYLCQ